MQKKWELNFKKVVANLEKIRYNQEVKLNKRKELTQEDISELLKDKEVLYLLQDLKIAKTFEDNIKITLYIKKGEIKDKEYKTKKYHRGK